MASPVFTDGFVIAVRGYRVRMADFEDKTKQDRELYLRPAPDAKVRRELSKMPEPHSSISYGGMQQVTPPSRDGKVRKPESAESSQKRFKTFVLIILASVGVVAMMNYRRVADMIYTSIATVEMLRGDLDGAATHYKAAYYINPDDVNPLELAASIHLGQKKDQIADEEFKEVFRVAKNPATAHNQRAKILNGMGRTKEALADWDEAIRMDPKYYAAHAQRALIYQNAQRYADSLKEWDAAIANELDPKDVYCLSQKAYVLSQLNRNREALDTINLALLRNPTNEGLIKQRSYFQSHI